MYLEIEEEQDGKCYFAEYAHERYEM